MFDLINALHYLKVAEPRLRISLLSPDNRRGFPFLHLSKKAVPWEEVTQYPEEEERQRREEHRE